MALFNYATKEITLKIVYYGPGLSGKTTNLQYLHSVLNPDTKGKLLSLSTESDRTLFFDFLPVELGKIREFSIRFQLYTVPGQIRYNATRKVVLKGADAVVFVADSQREMVDQNIESFLNMRENLVSNNINPDEIPLILQYNKRDLKNISSIEEMNTTLNSRNYDVIEAVAVKGTGVEDSFKLITKLIIRHISRKHKIEILPAQEKEEIRQPAVPAQIKEFVIPIPGPEPISQKKSAGYTELTPEYTPQIPVPEPITLKKSAGHTELTPEYTPQIPVPEPITLKKSAGHAEPTPEFDLKEKVVTEIKNDTAASLEKINMITDEVKKIRATLSDLQMSVANLGKGAGDISAIKKGQEETNSILRAIINIIEGLKIKKSWFKF